MILSLEDIAGASSVVGFLIWLFFTGLFYLVLYMAVLNVLDRKTGNHPIKIPLMLMAAGPSACFMAIFNYNPMILAVLMTISNHFRIKGMSPLPPVAEGKPPRPIKPALFYFASYLYIAAVYGFAVWFQQPVELDGMTKPYWKTWFTEVPH